MKIKVCGLKFPENIDALSALMPDYMGFIFYQSSPRFIDDLQVEVLKNIPDFINKTAVFVDEDKKTISALINKYDFGTIQLHGNEGADFCNYFKEKATLIKAFGLHEGFDFDLLKNYEGKVDFFLFDFKTAIHGGSGNKFDWDILNRYKLNTPFFLSGGLALENLLEIKKISHPQFYGVDLNSRFETTPGMKDINKLEKAFHIIKQTANELRS